MLILLSPAKTQNFDPLSLTLSHTIPQKLAEIAKLVTVLRTYDPQQLGQLMSISPKLAQLNHARLQAFDTDHFSLANAKPAVYAFEGDAYRSLAVHTFSDSQLHYLQQHLFILSGLYGLLRPLDLIQPYRLEMSIKLAVGKFKNLYEFWQDKITQGINNSLASGQHRFLVNLASEEYFKAVHSEKLTVPVVNVQFKQFHGGKYKTIAIYAKRARGLMTRFIIENEISTLDHLKQFAVDGYSFAQELSHQHDVCFVRS